MTYQAFQDEVLNYVSAELSGDASVTIHHVKKNNGVTRTGLMIREKDINISPSIYLDDYYDRVASGTPFKDVARDIVSAYRQFKPEDSLDIEFFTNYETVREKVFYKLVNTEKNKELLSEIPSVPFLDLSIIFCVNVDSCEGVNGTITIRNEHLALWGKNIKDLMQAAKENTERLFPPFIKSLNEYITSITEVEYFPEIADMIPVYILTNESMIFGAAAILYDKVLEEMATRFQSDLIIIPSSIHETLILPEKTEDDTFHSQSPEALINMIREVNDSVVSPTDILSYTAYRYSYSEKKITSLSCA